MDQFSRSAVTLDQGVLGEMMKAGATMKKMYEALDLLQQASTLLLSVGELSLVAHLATPIDLIEDRLQRTVQ
jgi:hypothetical protein